MNRTRISGSLATLLLASVLPIRAQVLSMPSNTTGSARADGIKEPAGVKGYVTWTDPASGKKHLVTGMAQNPRTGAWDVPVIADDGPILQVSFTAVTGGVVSQVLVDYSGDAYTLDAGGKRLPYRPFVGYRTGDQAVREVLRWPEGENPAAFRYDIRFTHDLSYLGQPLLETKTLYAATGTANLLPPEFNYFRVIRYNPSRHHFSDIKIKTDQIFKRPQIAVNLQDFLTNPPTQPRRATPFADLPAF